jgi:hypothetical protein
MTSEQFQALVDRLEHQALSDPNGYTSKVLLLAVLGNAYVVAMLLLIVALLVALVASVLVLKALAIKLILPLDAPDGTVGENRSTWGHRDRGPAGA